MEDDMDQMETIFNQVTASQTRIQSLLWGLMSAILVAVILLALNLAADQVADPAPGAPSNHHALDVGGVR